MRNEFQALTQLTRHISKLIFSCFNFMLNLVGLDLLLVCLLCKILLQNESNRSATLR